MLTLVAVLLHPPILHPSFSLCYLLCCSLFILCSGKDLPWSHWCCLHKRQNSIWWCKALWRHHRMFFWGKIRGKKRMMRRPASLISLSFNASSCISLISICYWTKSEQCCLLECLVCGKKANVICKRSFPEFTHQTTSKNVVLYAMNHQHWTFTETHSNYLCNLLHSFYRPLNVFSFDLEIYLARFSLQGGAVNEKVDQRVSR